MTEIKKYNGRSAIFVDGEPLASPMAFIRTRTRDENNKLTLHFDPEYFKNLRKSGIRTFMISCNTLWLQPDALDVFDKEAGMLLEAVPDAYIIARFGLHPPVSWTIENPDECVEYSDGVARPCHLFTESYEADYPRMYSLLSQKWREDAGEALKETWGELLKRPYADRIIACFITAGHTSEWGYGENPGMLSSKDKACRGYSKAFRREFSSYLRELYGTDEELRRSWNNPDVSIDNPPIPTFDMHYFASQVDQDSTAPRQRIYAAQDVPPPPNNGTHIGSFTDMDACPQTYHFLRCWHQGTAKSQIYFAKVIKEMTPDRITIFCYGKQGCCNHVHGGQSGGTRLILNSPYVDCLENPSVYENRVVGGFVGQRVVQDTFDLHNKIYICQDDSRTLAENRFFRNKYQVYDMTDTIDSLKRDFGKCICEDMQSWWFDQLIGGKRYKFPEIYDLFSEQDAITKEAYSLDRTKKSEIAFIFDEESILAISNGSSYTLVETLRNHVIARIGAPVDQYYHDDMANPDMPSYKMYVFVNTLVLTEEERKVIKDKLKKDGAVAVWLYAPGFADPMADKKMSVEHMKDLTGMEIAMDDQCFDANFRWDGEAHPINKALDKRKLYGNFYDKRMSGATNPTQVLYRDTYLSPLFYSADKDAKDLAHFASSGYPAVSVKECDGFTSVFYGSKTIDHATIRELARFAGAHIYCESGDVTYVGANYITFHASSSGLHTLYLKTPATVYEVYEKKIYGEDITELTFEAYFGETKMFRIETK